MAAFFEHKNKAGFWAGLLPSSNQLPLLLMGLGAAILLTLGMSPNARMRLQDFASQLHERFAAGGPALAPPVSLTGKVIAASPFLENLGSAQVSTLFLVRGDPEDNHWTAWSGSVAGERIKTILTPEEARKSNPLIPIAGEDSNGSAAASVDNVDMALADTLAPGRMRGKSYFVRRHLRSRRNTAAKNDISLCLGDECAFKDLADGRVMSSWDQPCTALKGCLSEDAAADVASIYDGGVPPQHFGSLPLDKALPQVDETAVPNLDSEDNAAALQEASRIEGLRRQCDAADKTYLGSAEIPGPEIVARQQWQESYQALTDLGCLASRSGACVKIAQETAALCRDLNSVAQSHFNACPLERQMGPFKPMECGNFED